MTISAWIAVVEVVWVIGLSAWIILERRSPVATLAWVLALAWVPVVGIFLYLLIGPRRLRRRKLRYRRSSCSVADASVGWRERPEDVLDVGRPVGADRELANLAERTGQAPPSRARRVDLLLGGDACYGSIERAVLAARHHVHLEYYIWEPDRIGTRFRDLLCERARSGVEVRLLVDAIGSAWLGRRFLRPLMEAGARVAWFNPISLARLRPDLMNFRTHRKIVVCDGEIGFTGGINMCDQQSATIAGDRAWRDTHLRIEGRPVGDLQLAFLEDWHFATGRAPRGMTYFPGEDADATGPCVQVLASGPDSDSYSIEKFCFGAISGAKRRVHITTPYFVPNEPLLLALSTAALRGVDVRILVPHRSDSRLVTAATRSYFHELASVGIRIYEYRSSMLHAKTLLADDVALVGTANMDNRSFRLNFEVAAAVFDKGFADLLADIFRADMQRGTEYQGQSNKRISFCQRMSEATARLMSPLL